MATPEVWETHYTREDLEDYFSGLMPDEEAIPLEEHLGACDQCMTRAGELSAVLGARSHWTAETHREAYLAAGLAEALARAPSTVDNQSWRERLLEWKRRYGARAAAAVRVMNEAPGKVGQLVAESLTTPAFLVSAAELAPAGAPVRTRGAVRTRGIPRAGAQDPMRVTVSAGGTAMEIRVDNPPAGTQPLVLLIPSRKGAEPRVVALTRVAGQSYALARFEDVPAGDYVVALEPVTGR